MENVYKTPESKLINESDNDHFDYQLYKISGIGIATFFGSVLAGGFLLAHNFKKLGNDEAAKKSLIYSVIATVVLLVIAFLIPEDWNVPNAAFTIPQIIVMVQIAKQQQQSDITRHTDNGGAMVSNWKAFGISLLVLLGIIVIAIPVAMLFV